MDSNPRSEEDQKRKGNAKKTAPDSTVKKQKDKTTTINEEGPGKKSN